MAYIGKSPVIGNFVKLDAITAVNGQAAYTMQNGGSNFTDYESVNQFLVSLNGTIQAPTDSFTVSGSTLTFASNLSTGDVIDFIMVFGNSLSAGTPTDNTVTAAKLNNDIISGQTELASEPADTDEFLVSDAGTLKRIDYSLIKGGGKINQVLQAVKTDTQDGTSSNTWTDISSLSQSITPSATDSKILVLFHVNCAASTNDHVAIRLLRGSTAIHIGTSGDTGRNVFSGIRFMSDDQYHAVVMAGQYLDSPSTTSATTYKLQVNSNSGYYINRSQTTGGTTTVQRPQSVSGITLMEVLA